jgi:hypothetical protein
VRADPSFFADLDDLLPAERGPSGEPSAHDFLAFDLLRVVEVFTSDFDGLPTLFEDRDDYRVLITAGVVVPRFAVVGRLAADDAVELLELDVDFEPPR